VGISFGANIAPSDMSVTLNGVTYNSSSPSVTITPSGGTNQPAHCPAGVFSDANYGGNVSAKNAAVLTSGCVGV
jgi:hypothetical protein